MNILIVDDSETARGYLQSILSGIPGVAVIGHAANEAGATELIDTLLPDIVILDISMRNGAVIDMLENIKKRHPTIKVMMLTDCTNEFYFNCCKRAGEDHFFDKDSQLMRIRAALWQCYRLDNRFEALQTP